MTSQAASPAERLRIDPKLVAEPSFYSDPFRISPCYSPQRFRHAAIQPSKLQLESACSSPRSYPVSVRAYNKKDYDYIASFPRATHMGASPNRSESEFGQCQELYDRCKDDAAKAMKKHSPKGSHVGGNVVASTKVYADVVDCIRKQKTGGSSPVQSLPSHLRSPARGLAKELAVAKIPSQVSPHNRKRTCSSWICCFNAPLTTE